MEEKKYIVEVKETEWCPVDECGGTTRHTMTSEELVAFFQEEMVKHDYKKLGKHCSVWEAEWEETVYSVPYVYTRTISVQEA